MKSSCSELQRSPNKFDFDVSKFVPNEEILMLSELPCLSNFQKVCIKVVCEREVEEVIIKQAYVIGDSSGYKYDCYLG